MWFQYTLNLADNQALTQRATAAFQYANGELLKFYAAGVPDEYLAEIKEMIVRYLLTIAAHEAGQVWREKDYSDATADKWVKGD